MQIGETTGSLRPRKPRAILRFIVQSLAINNTVTRIEPRDLLVYRLTGTASGLPRQNQAGASSTHSSFRPDFLPISLPLLRPFAVASSRRLRPTLRSAHGPSTAQLRLKPPRVPPAYTDVMILPAGIKRGAPRNGSTA